MALASDKERVYSLVLDLTNADLCENALIELSKTREHTPELAPLLWHSIGVMTVL
jgi:CCR4-NOT transcription complex subunit 9